MVELKQYSCSFFIHFHVTIFDWMYMKFGIYWELHYKFLQEQFLELMDGNMGCLVPFVTYGSLLCFLFLIFFYNKIHFSINFLSISIHAFVWILSSCFWWIISFFMGFILFLVTLQISWNSVSWQSSGSGRTIFNAHGTWCTYAYYTQIKRWYQRFSRKTWVPSRNHQQWYAFRWADT